MKTLAKKDELYIKKQFNEKANEFLKKIVGVKNRVSSTLENNQSKADSITNNIEETMDRVDAKQVNKEKTKGMIEEVDTKSKEIDTTEFGAYIKSVDALDEFMAYTHVLETLKFNYNDVDIALKNEEKLTENLKQLGAGFENSLRDFLNTAFEYDYEKLIIEKSCSEAQKEIDTNNEPCIDSMYFPMESTNNLVNQTSKISNENDKIIEALEDYNKKTNDTEVKEEKQFTV